MIDIKEVALVNGEFVSAQDARDASELILAHLAIEPDFIRTAAHTLDGVTEWFGRKKLDNFWFAEQSARRVGMIGLTSHIYDSAHHSHLEDVEVCRLMVSPEVRGNGLGRELFNVALAACEGRFPWLTVLVGSDAHKMYCRWGWVELGCVPSQDDPFDHIVAMRPQPQEES